ncbi:MAG: HAMP domain-containing protein [Mariprofundaceae bacterium]
MSLRWVWSFSAVLLTAVVSVIMALSILSIENEARRASEDNQIRLLVSILSEAVSIPMMAHSLAEVDSILNSFIEDSSGAIVHLHWRNGTIEQFGNGRIPKAVSSLSGVSQQAIPVQGLEGWYARGINFNEIRLGTIALYMPTSGKHIYTGKSLVWLGLLTFFLALLSGILVYRFCGDLSKSMQILSDASRQVGEGDFSVHVPSYGRREIRGAIGSFNQMVSSLAHRQAIQEVFGHYKNPQQVSDAFDKSLIFTNRPSRKVSVVVVGMVNFVDYMSGSQKFDALSGLNQFFKLLIEIITTHGGHIDCLSGDRLVAVFNHPANLRNYQNIAAEIALVAMELSKKLSLSRPDGSPVVFRAGLAHGEAMTGYLGEGKCREFRIVGAPLTMAEQLLILGKGHEVLADRETMLQLGRDFGHKDLGVLTLADGQNIRCVTIKSITEEMHAEIEEYALAALNSLEADIYDEE